MFKRRKTTYTCPYDYYAFDLMKNMQGRGVDRWIRDWLAAEVDMLRAQPVAVGDVDEILQQLDKQKKDEVLLQENPIIGRRLLRDYDPARSQPLTIWLKAGI
ncbi:hypothetical protein EVAR_3978_1 [Eumeta japonica]|uniref:Uncharacterized protein n=1 Tax=Eumeta variegata TaxID=151549 RepID=A0A4C1STX0_EUMVA|nr:hypothetical protein EVAR_3978_1 [Eumeta japonica]